MFSHADHLALSPHQVAWAISLALAQAACGAAIVLTLRRFRARSGGVTAGQQNPFAQPAVIAAAVGIFVAIAGMVLMVGRGWTLAIEAPVMLGSVLITARQNRAR